MPKFKLKRIHQCAKCPWKTSTNPYDIPDSYSLEKHKNLGCTIAKEGDMLGANTHVMSCHEHSTDEQVYCVGWLHQQLGIGNNVPLRIRMMNCENISQIKVVGKQHERFEDTLPKTEQYHGA